jgi:oxygen-dependent protoporphyrinogen oxidase
MRIAIVGGGISGLSTAFYLKQNRPELEIQIFERDAHLGGTMYTEEVEGFLFEVGSNGFLTNKPATLELVKASGAEDLLMRSDDAARVRYIYTDALHRLPESPPAFLRSKLLSLRGKLRVAGEYFTPPKQGNDDESLQSFGYRRVGKEFTDVFLDAMSAGIYASTPAALSVNAAFPLVVNLEREYGGLFRGMIKKRKKSAGPGGVLMSFKGGVGTYIDHLREHLDARFHLGEPVEALAREGAGYRVITPAGEHRVDCVVLAVPSFVAADIMADLDGDLAERLRGIEYSPVAVVGFGWHDLDHPLDGFGLLTTSSAGQQVLGILWDSSVFPDRAPEGQKSVRVMIGGQRQPALALKPDAELIALARDGLATTMGVTREADVTFLKRWERGIPNYKVGHLKYVNGIFDQLKAHPGLFLNSNAYYGIGVNDCVANSKTCARHVLDKPAGPGARE